MATANNLGSFHWENYLSTGPMYIVAGQAIRAQYVCSTAHNVSSRWKISKVNFL